MRSTKKIPVMEIFGPTFQGEGALCGTQTFFIRFGGCDYRCDKCDSMHAVLPELIKAGARYNTQEEILQRFLEHIEANIQGEYSAPWITFSGGNPCMHDLSELVTDLKAMGYLIAVETQGTLNPQWLADVDMLTISPKGPGMGEQFEPDKFETMLRSALSAGVDVAVKTVVFSNVDLEFSAVVFDIVDRIYEDFPTEATVGKYFSLGNPYPPFHTNTKALSAEAAIRTVPFDDLQRLELLRAAASLAEDILQDGRFRDVIFLPQMHVLFWANKAEV